MWGSSRFSFPQSTQSLCFLYLYTYRPWNGIGRQGFLYQSLTLSSPAVCFLWKHSPSPPPPAHSTWYRYTPSELFVDIRPLAGRPPVKDWHSLLSLGPWTCRLVHPVEGPLGCPGHPISTLEIPRLLHLLSPLCLRCAYHRFHPFPSSLPHPTSPGGIVDPSFLRAGRFDQMT